MQYTIVVRDGAGYPQSCPKPHNLMSYRGYIGSVEFSEEDGLFYGKIQGIRSLISYEGTNARELLLPGQK